MAGRCRPDADPAAAYGKIGRIVDLKCRSSAVDLQSGLRRSSADADVHAGSIVEYHSCSV